jgi:HAD superfamily hydrolase (TIGR01450 family)
MKGDTSASHGSACKDTALHTEVHVKTERFRKHMQRYDASLSTNVRVWKDTTGHDRIRQYTTKEKDMPLRYCAHDSGDDCRQGWETIRSLLAEIRCWLLDMDGTVSLGEDRIPGTERFFDALKDQRYIFVTNNSSHSAAHYEERMNRIGIRARRDEILTSTDALLMYLDGVFGRPIRAYPVGTPDFESELESGGVTLIREKDAPVDAVLVGFDTTLNYAKLDGACSHIRSGAPWYAANPDKVCPLPGGRVLPDCGAIIAFLETCTGTSPAKIIGKPDTAMVEMVLARYGYRREEVAMVGDRIYTDMAVARNAGILCVGVLSGESTLKEIIHSGVKPDLIVDHLGDLADFL